jgi:2-polyprenyl-6-methoxyphenol hydroxylase-like FAD-dependent oxidoreductase
MSDIELCPDVLRTPVMVVGAGISGASSALALASLGIRVVIFENRDRHFIMGGAGINLQASAIGDLKDLGLTTEALKSVGNVTKTQSYYTPDGRLVCALDKSGKSEEDPGQISVHRGGLLGLLLEACDKNDNIQILTNHKVVSIDNEPDKVVLKVEDRKTKNQMAFTGSMCIGADGVHSKIRKHNILRNQKEWDDPRRYHGVTHYRGVCDTFPHYLDGQTMLIVGGRTMKYVIYPIATPKCGKQRINWIACVKEDRRRNSFSNSYHDKLIELTNEHGFDLDFLDITELVKSTAEIGAWPMIDCDPLETWVRNRIALTGDAAHGMLPVGSGGAMAALFDGLAFKEAFENAGPVPVADVLKLYQSLRYKSASRLQTMARSQPAETIMEEVVDKYPKGTEFPDSYGDSIRAEMKKLHNPDRKLSLW